MHPTKNSKKSCLSLNYNGAYSCLCVKTEESEIKPTPLCLGSVSKDFSVDNMKETGLNGYVYDFSVNYDAIAVDDILNII